MVFYKSFKEYSEGQEGRVEGDLREKWYSTHIKGSKRNKDQLIRENRLSAYEVFIQFGDLEGLERIARSGNSDDEAKRLSKMSINSIHLQRSSGDERPQEKTNYDIVTNSDSEVARVGRTQEDADLIYHGGVSVNY